MNAIEAAKLCNYVQACCPQQKFNEYSPDAWYDLLGDLPLWVARVAAGAVAKHQPFVSPSEIRTAAQRIRNEVRHAYCAEEAERLGVNGPGGDAAYIEWHEWRRTNWDGSIAEEVDQRIVEGYYDISDVKVTGEKSGHRATLKPNKPNKALEG